VPRSRARIQPRLVTLSSDVGPAYAAQMKAVLARSMDPGRVVDLAHDLRAHAVEEAAFVVRTMAAGFPPGTVHVVVVDPGVGGRRAPIVIDCRDGSRLVGPDNGVLYPLAQLLGLGPAYRIERGLARALPRVGTTFDGRDVFAPAAAQLAAGRRPSTLGPPTDPKAFAIPTARRRAQGGVGEVVHADWFGNLVTNVPSEWVPRRTRRLEVRVGQGPSRPAAWCTSYEQIGAYRLGALGSSFGTVELAVGRGRALTRLRAHIGTPVRFRWLAHPARRVRA